MPPSAVLLLLAAVLVACASAASKPPGSLGSVKYDYEPLPNNTAVYGTSVRSPTTLDVYYLFGWNGPNPKNDKERPANAMEAAANCTSMGLEQPDEFHPEDYKWTAFLDNMNRVTSVQFPKGLWGSWVKSRPGNACTRVYDLSIDNVPASDCPWWRGMYVCVKRDPKCGSLRCCWNSACCSGKICCHTGTKCCKATLQRRFPVCVQSGKACPP